MDYKYKSIKEDPICNHPKTVEYSKNMVRGISKRPEGCTPLRDKNGLCGPSAKLFEPKLTLRLKRLFGLNKEEKMEIYEEI